MIGYRTESENLSYVFDLRNHVWKLERHQKVPLARQEALQDSEGVPVALAPEGAASTSVPANSEVTASHSAIFLSTAVSTILAPFQPEFLASRTYDYTFAGQTNLHQLRSVTTCSCG